MQNGSSFSWSTSIRNVLIKLSDEIIGVKWTESYRDSAVPLSLLQIVDDGADKFPFLNR